MKKINIAIDGPSAAGKSTIAKQLAEVLQYSHIDTGAMYRCCAWKASKLGLDILDESAIVEMLKQTTIEVRPSGQVLLDGEDVTIAIREHEMSMLASTISKHARVREQLVKQQQDMVKERGFILDGRDIGSVVMPDAELKIYQTASVQTRALRRFKENQSKGIDCTLEEIALDIQRRDDQDMNRASSPLVKVADAIELDTSDIGIEESVALILNYVKKITT